MHGCIVGELGAREEVIPGGGVLLDEAAEQVAKSLVSDLRLTIRLRVKRGRKLECRSHQSPQSLPEITGETDITVGDDTSRYAVEADHLIEEQSGSVGGVRGS